MKQLLIPGCFALAVFTLSSCEKNDRIGGCTDPFAINFDQAIQVSDDDGSCVYPPEIRKALMYKVTATWCPPCGDWGTKEFHDAVDSNKADAVIMTLHAAGDPMHNALVDAFETDYGITGYPTLVVNHAVDFYDAAGMTTAVKDFVTGEPAVSAISIFEIKGDKAIITAQTRWFEEMTGQLYCAIYLLEDGIVEDQATPTGYITDYVHDYVLRASASGDAFGESVLNGEAWVGKAENLEYEVTLDPFWNKANLRAVTVLWRQGAEGYEFVNAYNAVTR